MIELIDKIKPKNNGSFALIDSQDISVDSNDKRLNTKIAEIEASINSGGGSGGGSSSSTILAENVIVDAVSDKRLDSVVNEVDFLNSGLEVSESGDPTFREIVSYKYVKKSIYNVNSKTTYGNNSTYQHAFFSVLPGETYYVTGSTPSNADAHPLCAFYDVDGAILGKYGTTINTVYIDEEVVAPANSSYMVVNKTGSQITSVSVKRSIPSTGISVIDKLNISVMDLETNVTKIQSSLDEENNVLMGTIITPDSINAGCYNINNGSLIYTDNEACQHAIFTVSENSYYFVTGNSLTNSASYPLCAFFDENDNELGEYGIDKNQSYTDLLVKAPVSATKLIVNKSWSGITIVVKTGLAQSSNDEKLVASTRSYNLDMADSLIRLNKQNPFVFKSFEKGYITFVFDDLCNDLDSVASLFEQYNYPLVLAAIPDKMTEKCNYLQETRGSFTPGMVKKDIMDLVVAKGGEIMTHNSSPTVTEVNQYDYDFMYSYFCTSKQNLNNAGFYPRGIIRAGGGGAINRSTEIDRWLVGNYEYANMGTLPQYAWDRTTIQQSQEALKEVIHNAKTNNEWIKFMCHSYTFGNGDTFTGEDDLIELLEYCKTLNIDVVTISYMFDRYGSNTFEERLKALEG